MKTIGLIGGMSWESTQVYYQIINQKTNALLGGHHSAQCLIYSVDFETVVSLQHQENWTELNHLMASAAKILEQAGAGLLLICTNTMHMCSEAIRQEVNIPLLHIAEATGVAIQSQRLKKVALLGTRFTMEKDFYKNILLRDYGIEVLIPSAESRQDIHDIIYQELVHGHILAQSKKRMLKIIDGLIQSGAEGIVLGCTEIPLLIKAGDLNVSVFDTTRIHAEAAVALALQ